METMFFYCSVVGGSFMIIQFLLAMLGIGADVDDVDFNASVEPDVALDADAASSSGHSSASDIFKILSLRTMIAFCTFFGLGGLAGLKNGFSEPVSFICAIVLGSSAMLLVYFVYRWIYSLKYDGSVSEKTLVGCQGNVYLPIPENGKGIGKVQVVQQSRTMEYEAITEGEALSNGTPIIVTRVISPTTVEVRRLQ